MAQNSDTCKQVEQAVDYELISGDTGRTIKIPQRPIPPGSVILPRWLFYCLLGLAGTGFVAGGMLFAAVIAFTR